MAVLTLKKDTIREKPMEILNVSKDVYMDGFDNFLDVRNYHATNIYPHYPNMFTALRDRFRSSQSDDQIQRQKESLIALVDNYIGSSYQNYNKARELGIQFARTGKPDSLLHLFTLETPFYRYIYIE